MCRAKKFPKWLLEKIKSKSKIGHAVVGARYIACFIQANFHTFAHFHDRSCGSIYSDTQKSRRSSESVHYFGLFYD